jgi:hypothetical protein|tara:strand:- start:910 stop:1026 length:117 start_codon:yes stop_codon:yes gene_type:complete
MASYMCAPPHLLLERGDALLLLCDPRFELLDAKAAGDR